MAQAYYALKLQEYSNEFDAMAEARHRLGAEKYGPVRFTEVDSLQMALEEVADLANYARYTFVKIRMLQDGLSGAPANTEPVGAADREGKFISFRRDKKQ